MMRWGFPPPPNLSSEKRAKPEVALLARMA
jgi:hypothetical protein